MKAESYTDLATKSLPTLRRRDGYSDTSPDLKSAVEFLQRLLKIGGHDVEVDGLYGPATERAVEHVQKAAGIERDGIVGFRTWSALRGEEIPTIEFEYATSIPHNSRAHLKILKAAEEYRPIIEKVATRINVLPSIIVGIGSRETGWGTSRYLDKPGPEGRGDFGHGHGLMQIDDRSHTDFLRTKDWRDPEDNIGYGGEVLARSLRYVANNTSLTDLMLLRGGIAGYNCGPARVARAVRRGRGVDYYTTGRNYSADVISRAGFAQLHGWT